MTQTYTFEAQHKGVFELRVNTAQLKHYAAKPTLAYQASWEGLALNSTEKIDPFYEWQSIDYVFTPAPTLAVKAPFALFINRRQVAKSNTVGTQVLLHGNFRFENTIGPTRLSIYDKYNQLVFCLNTEVYPQKLDYKEDYRTMLEDISRITYNLAYSYFKDTFEKGSLQEAGKSSLLEFVAIIRVLFESLDKSIEVIRRHPKRKITTSNRIRNIDQVRKLGRHFPKWLRSNQQYLNKDGRGLLLGNDLGVSHAPEQKKVVTFDTYENRFVVWAMQQLLVQLREVQEVLSKNYPQAIQDLDLITQFTFRLRQRLQQGPFNQVSGFKNQLHFSTTLTMASGYKDFFHKFLMLQQGISLANNDIFQLEVKDIATLYEYWCFLKIVDILQSDPNYQLESQDLIKLEGGHFVIKLKTGKQSKLKFHRTHQGEFVTLYFNRSFSKKGGKVFTYDQRPDYAIQFQKGGYENPFWFLFDAKYRFEETERKGKLEYFAPQDAIGQLHRYRDAILHSKPQNRITYRAAVKNLGGIILYPYPKSEESFIGNPFYKSIAEVNIGALPFLPTKTSLFKSFLDRLISSSPETHFEHFLEMDKNEYESYLKRLRETILIGLVPKSEAEARKRLLFDQGYYAIRTHANTKLKLYHAKWFIPYLQDKKQLESLYQVSSIEITSASHLRSLGAQWKLSSDSYILYKLQHETSLNIDVSLSLRNGYRYTNPVAFDLFRANNTPQFLHINDLNSLRLYQELTAHQISFKITRGKDVTLSDHEFKIPQLRFELEDGRIIYNIPGSQELTWSNENGNTILIKDLTSST